MESFYLVFVVGELSKILKVVSTLREGKGTPLQYSCLENPMDGGAWYAAVHGVAKSQTWLSDFTFTFHFHALEKEMATYSSVLAWRKSRTRLKWLSSSSKHFSQWLKKEKKELYSSINTVKGIFLTDYLNNVYFKLHKSCFPLWENVKNKSEKKL